LVSAAIPPNRLETAEASIRAMAATGPPEPFSALDKIRRPVG